VERFLKIPHQTFVRLTHLAQKRNCLAVIPVYLALLYHADNHGRCFPGYERIIELSGVKSQTTVAKALQILEREGLILVQHTRGKGGSNRYVLQFLHSLEKKPPITPMNGVNNSNEWSQYLQSLESITPMNGDELDPFNYNQLTISNELEERRREKNGRYRKFGPPENPEDDWKYYGFSRGFLTVERERGHVNHYQLTGYTSSVNEEPTSMNEEHLSNHWRTPLQ